MTPATTPPQHAATPHSPRQISAPSLPTTEMSLDDLVCPDGICAAVSPDGLITYRDSSHMTASYSRSLSEGLVLALRDELPD